MSSAGRRHLVDRLGHLRDRLAARADTGAVSDHTTSGESGR
ncbi:MAG: hypothetical protein ACJ73S_27875 [Mycobacteriales bacterium]